MTFSVLALILASAVIHAVWNALTKRSGGDIAVLTIAACIAGAISLIPALGHLPTADALAAGAPYMLATMLVHFFYFRALGTAYEHGEISAVYPVARGIGVAGTGLLAFLLLGEHISLVGALGILAVTAGAQLIRRSADGHAHASAMTAALAVGSMVIMYSLIDKVAVGILHPTVYNAALFGGAGALLAGWLRLRRPGRLTAAWRTHRNAILTIGVGQVASYLLALYALTAANVSYVVAARESSIVFGSFFGVWFFKERLGAARALGIAAIVAGLVLVKLA